MKLLQRKKPFAQGQTAVSLDVIKLVVDTGLEPATPTMSRWCSTN